MFQCIHVCLHSCISGNIIYVFQLLVVVFCVALLDTLKANTRVSGIQDKQGAFFYLDVSFVVWLIRNCDSSYKSQNTTPILFFRKYHMISLGRFFHQTKAWSLLLCIHMLYTHILSQVCASWQFNTGFECLGREGLLGKSINCWFAAALGEEATKWKPGNLWQWELNPYRWRSSPLHHSRAKFIITMIIT